MNKNFNRLAVLGGASQISFLVMRGDCTHIYQVSEDQKTMKHHPTVCCDFLFPKHGNLGICSFNDQHFRKWWLLYKDKWMSSSRELQLHLFVEKEMTGRTVASELGRRHVFVLFGILFLLSLPPKPQICLFLCPSHQLHC